MIPKSIDQAVILQAIGIVSQQNYPTTEKSDKYDLYFESKRYPPKVIIRKAISLVSNAEPPKIYGGEKAANKYLRKLGFIIVEKQKLPEDYFFNKEEIDFFMKYNGVTYDSSNSIHKVLLHLLKYSLRPKTNKWIKNVTPYDYEYQERNSPLKRNHWSMSLRTYTWASLTKKSANRKDVYFTVGVHASKSNGGPCLVYKLDYHYQGNFSETEINYIESTIKEHGADWELISLSQFPNYSWQKLFSETREFIYKYEYLYDMLLANLAAQRLNQIGNPKITTKVCRICWNTNGWVKPSGRDGKANSKAKTHEKEFGFGHEEWLLDIDKTYKGYHYGFLQPIRNYKKKQNFQKINVILYTQNSLTKEKFWVGRLNNVQILSPSEIDEILEYYNSVGWLGEMKDDLQAVNLKSNTLVNDYINLNEIFNIKFKPAEIENIFKSYRLVESSDSIIKSNRYSLLSINEQENSSVDEKVTKHYSFESGNDGEKGSKKTIKSSGIIARPIERVAKHNEMSDKFLAFLKSLYGTEMVKRECIAYDSTRIDIVRRTSEGDIFYELKTYNFLEISLREALGQLFEYCFYPETKNAIKLYLVSNRTPEDDFLKYLNQLNKFIKIPLGYIQFDLEKNEIVFESQ